MSSGLFGDLLVVDCASFIAGPAAATVLSDFGARVIKIEPPGIGDSYRNLFRLRGTPEDVDYFWTLDSRNKESLALDLRRAEARAVLQTLVRKADVFITNIPFPARERLGARHLFHTRHDDLLRTKGPAVTIPHLPPKQKARRSKGRPRRGPGLKLRVRLG